MQEEKSIINLLFFIFRLIIGLLAICSFILLLINKESVLIFVPALLLSIIWVVVSIKEIIAYFKNP